jgi:hypothetical protein
VIAVDSSIQQLIEYLDTFILVIPGSLISCETHRNYTGILSYMTTYIQSSFIPFHVATGIMAPIGIPVCSDKGGSLVFVQHIAVHK